MRVALNRAYDALRGRTMEGQETDIKFYDSVRQETSDKATETGQEASFLIETELEKLS